MIVATSELIGPALDWAVMKAEGKDSFAAAFYYDGDTPLCVDDQDIFATEWHPSTDWSQGGLIIEREDIELIKEDDQWYGRSPTHGVHGLTPLIAAMRCFVASKLGDRVEYPDDLYACIKCGARPDGGPGVPEPWKDGLCGNCAEEQP